MIVVARLDKAVLGEGVALAIADELAVTTKDLRLVLQEVHDLHRRTLLVVVVNLGRVTRLHHALVNTQDRILDVKEIHIHVAEGGAVVRESAVANGWTRNRRKPAVENGILGGEPGEHGQLFRWEVRHDGVRRIYVRALRGVALDEPLHVCDATWSQRSGAENLEVHAGEVVIGIMIQLALEFRIRLRFRLGH